MRLMLSALLALMPAGALASAFSNLPSAGGAAPSSEGIWGGLVASVYAMQTAFYQAMNGALGEMRADGTAGLYLMGFALLYGFFHAAGPGHGKVVVSSYVLADRLTLRKGIFLSFLSAAVQGLVAIGLISIAAILFRFTRGELMAQAGYLEKASFALIAVLGLAVIFRALWPLLSPAPRARLAGAGGMVLAHAHRHEHHGHEGRSSHPHHHDHDGHPHHHGDDCGCGHAHMPAAEDVKALSGPAEFLAAAFSIGLRPCTGALVVLVFALAQGLYLAGIAAVVVMSVGTAIMVSIIAALAVGARDLALRLWGGEQRGRLLSAAFQVTGGLVLFLFGLAMFMGPVQGG